MFKPCIIIPVYNHGKLLQGCITKILSHNIALIIIDDGSNLETQKILQKISANNSQIILHHLKENQGKGTAMLCGFELANIQGFTHALQIDADNQHLFDDIPLFLGLAKSNPQTVINGLPIYDNSVPKSRLYGRKITNFWVAIETLSGDVKDAMCGFRVYPLKSVMEIIQKQSLSKRMGFDIEIIVRLYWSGLAIINQPTEVKYPADGISHFRMFKDNLEISLLHTKLFFGMIWHLFSLLKRKFYE